MHTEGGSAGREPAKPVGSTELHRLHLWQMQPVRDVLVIGAIAGAIYAGYAMRTVTVPLLIALALAYLFEPVVSRVSRWRFMSRPLAVTMILGALGVVVAAVVGIVAPLAVGQALSFADSLRSGSYDKSIERVVELVPSEYREEVRSWKERLIHPSASRSGEEAAAAPEAAAADATAAQKTASSAPSLLESPVLDVVGSGSARVYSIAMTLLQLGLVAFLIPFYFYYFSVYWPNIVGFFASFVPDDRRESVGAIVSEMDRAVAGFVRGRIVICTVMGVMFAIGWQICGVPYGIALGLVTGILSIVPYLGGIGVPAAIGLLAVDQFGLDETQRMSLLAIALWPTAVFVIVQTVEGYVLTPIIAGKATNLDPVTIVVAILAGGSIAGVYGMLLAIPAAACGKIAAKRLLLPRIAEWARGRARDPLPLGEA